MNRNRHFAVIILLFSFGNAFSQNGKIISKSIIDLSKTFVWNNISENNILKPEFEYLNTVNFYDISYQSDSLPIKGMMIIPKKDEIYPVVIFNRGGNRNFSPLNIGTLILYSSKLAAQGYIVLGSNYREQDEFGGADINDVLNLMETAKEIETADTNNIGMLGWSRGGIMTYLALKYSDKIKTAIIGSSPVDLFSTITERPEMENNPISECIPDYWQNKKEELEKRSAIYWFNELNKNSSLLILCGTKDKQVNYKQAERMAEKLSSINYNYELKEYDTDHFFADKKKELNETIINWFDKKLKNHN